MPGDLSVVTTWHIITPEYPPQSGGVSDYTRLVAEGLAAEGDRVHVWCKSAEDREGRPQAHSTVSVHRSESHSLGKALDEFDPPRRLLVQWVPHGYGYRSMNLPFCLWLWNRSWRCGDRVELMVHEPFLAFGEGSWRQDAAALVHRLMTVILLQAV